MKKIMYLTLGLISLMAVACGGNKNEGNASTDSSASSSADSSAQIENDDEENANSVSSIDDLTTEVKLKVEPSIGDLGNYLSFTEKDVTLTYSNGSLKGAFKVDVKRAVCSPWPSNFDFDIKILDKNNQEVVTVKNFLKLKTKTESGPEAPSEKGHHYSKVVDAGSTLVEGKKHVGDSKWEKIAMEGKTINIVVNGLHPSYLPFPK